ncbi:hypothetical protein BH10CHL1_BH10CHL1_47600 [soil metagenome]
MVKKILTILLIEDSPHDRLRLQDAIRQFSQAGTVIHHAESGEAGIAACLAGTPLYDMILLDLTLPDMHGLDVLAKLRGHHEVVPYPVLVLAGHGQDDDAEAAFNAGAIDFIAKDSLLSKDLFRIINNSIKRFRLLQHLKDSEIRYRTLAAVAPVGIYRSDLTGDCLYVNERWCKFAGRPAEAAMGKGWLSAVQPEDRAAVNETWEQAIQQRAIFKADYRYQRPNGDTIWIYSQADLECDQYGTPLAYIGTITDITERKLFEDILQKVNQTLEQEVQERTTELVRSQSALDPFAYVASHDLKAPLRAIEHLSNWLAQDLEGVMPATSQAHLQKLRSRIKRMEKLLDDLLAYSRIGRILGEVSPVSFNKLMADILTVVSPEPAFEITYHASPSKFVTYRTPLEVVLRHLIDNALKHHHTKAGHIRIQAEMQDGLLHFSVADDGPGISPEFHERIFGIFQTLQPRDVVEGSGVGLAIVKKTIESFGGEISLESIPGQGSTFRFTWPIDQG